MDWRYLLKVSSSTIAQSCCTSHKSYLYRPLPHLHLHQISQQNLKTRTQYHTFRYNNCYISLNKWIMTTLKTSCAMEIIIPLQLSGNATISFMNPTLPHYTTDVTSGLVSAFVTTRMDYCNSILAALAALPQSSIDPLQRVQNAAARLITYNGTREKNITPALRSLHWLPVKFRIIFKLCV